jgi:hypothetical protein
MSRKSMHMCVCSVYMCVCMCVCVCVSYDDWMLIAELINEKWGGYIEVMKFNKVSISIISCEHGQTIFIIITPKSVV